MPLHATPTCARRMAAALLALATLVALGACGLGQAAATHATSGTPAPAGSGTVYFAANGVRALATGNGQPRWRDRFQDAAVSLASNGATLFAGAVPRDLPTAQSHGTLTALVAESGAKIWSRDYAGLAVSSVAATADTIIAVTAPLDAPGPQAADRPAIAALRASDGSLIWSVPTVLDAVALPILGDGAIYATTTERSSLVALDIRDGTPRWRLKLNGEPIGAPILSEGVLYLVERCDPLTCSSPARTVFNIVAVRAGDGALLWRFTPPDAYPLVNNVNASDLAAGDGQVYFSCAFAGTGDQTASSQGITALRAADGAVAWRQQVQYPHLSLQAVGGGMLYTTSQDRPHIWDNYTTTVHAYRTATGAAVFTRALPALSLGYTLNAGRARLVDGTLYLVATGTYYGTAPDQQAPLLYYVGVLFALDASTGTPRWHYEVDHEPGQQDAEIAGLVVAPD